MNNYKFYTMRRGVFIILIVLIIPGIRLAAQNSDMDKLNAYKIAFYTKSLNLSSQEAEKFWPVYNEYQKQKKIVHSEKGTINREFIQNGKSLSDKQLTELGDKLITIIVEESSLTVAFHNKLKDLLPPAKVLRFYQVENQYKVQLLNRLRNQRQQQRIAPGGL
jgi:hypothetical protein